MNFVNVRPAGRPLDSVVQLPGSKSLTNRAMLLAALADGRSTLDEALFSEDTELMGGGLATLGVQVGLEPRERRIEVTGCGGHLPASDADLFCGNSGTTIRFLAAACGLGMGSYRLDGVARMRERPIGPLVEAMRGQGVVVGYEDREGFPPVIVRGGGYRGGQVVFESPSSSQFVSAVMMAAPYARSDVFLRVSGDVVSAPYLSMTARLMDVFGVATVENIEPGDARWVIPAGQRYAAALYRVEPDASNATYFLAAPAVAGGRVTVAALGTTSLQGDIGFTDVLERMGCRVIRTPDSLTVEGPPPGQRLHGVDVDLNAMPDTAQTLAVTALFADGPTTIRNVANLRIKETDRLAALAAELRKFGAEVAEFDDGLMVAPPAVARPASVETYGDHRMAMSFALAGLVVEGVRIGDPGCVSKTFPDFFERFGRLAQ